MTYTLLARWREAEDIRVTTPSAVGEFLDRVATAPPGHSAAQLRVAEQTPVSLGDLGDVPATTLLVGIRPEGYENTVTASEPGVYAAR